MSQKRHSKRILDKDVLPSSKHRTLSSNFLTMRTFNEDSEFLLNELDPSELFTNNPLQASRTPPSTREPFKADQDIPRDLILESIERPKTLTKGNLTESDEELALVLDLKPECPVDLLEVEKELESKDFEDFPVLGREGKANKALFWGSNNGLDWNHENLGRIDEDDKSEESEETYITERDQENLDTEEHLRKDGGKIVGKGFVIKKNKEGKEVIAKQSYNLRPIKPKLMTEKTKKEDINDDKVTKKSVTCRSRGKGLDKKENIDDILQKGPDQPKTKEEEGKKKKEVFEKPKRKVVVPIDSGLVSKGRELRSKKVVKLEKKEVQTTVTLQKSSKGVAIKRKFEDIFKEEVLKEIPCAVTKKVKCSDPGGDVEKKVMMMTRASSKKIEKGCNKLEQKTAKLFKRQEDLDELFVLKKEKPTLGRIRTRQQPK